MDSKIQKKDPKLELVSPGEIRVRYSPSPTGPFHIGGARTALFNFLFARKNLGKFILRIEDTDKTRSKKEYEKEIIDSLKWLGIEPDEGPGIGGAYGPYRQSERTEIYEKYLRKLFSEDKIYPCFCSKEDLEAERQYQLSHGIPPHYTGKCANLPKEKVQKFLKEGRSFVLRFRMPSKIVEFKDLIKGKLKFDTSLIGDIVIAKSFKEPLYNFACVIDDYEMKITHVIRGEDILSNTPKQILIAESLGFPKLNYAHLPLIFGPDRTKLSKRHGAKSILEYKKEGFLPEAILNFIAFLGWNPGDEREIFNLDKLIQEFSLERVQKSPAIFNQNRLIFLNGLYIRRKDSKDLTYSLIPYLIDAGFLKEIINKNELERRYIIVETKKEIDFYFIEKIVLIYQERIKKLSEFPHLVDFFFKKDLEYPVELLKWKEMDFKNVLKSLDKIKKVLDSIKEDSWNRDNLKNIILKKIENVKDRGEYLWPFRVALTGKESSAPPFEIAEILQKKETINRLEKAIKRVKNTL